MLLCTYLRLDVLDFVEITKICSHTFHSVVISQIFPHAIFLKIFREIKASNDSTLKRTSENREKRFFAALCGTLPL